MNADPEKEMVALAQHYFATETFKSEQVKQSVPIELSRRDILVLALESEDARIAAELEVLRLAAQIEEDSDATFLGKAVLKASDNIGIGEFAKVLGDIGQNQYFNELRECNIIISNKTLLYQNMINSGYFVVTQKVVNDRSFPVALITTKGQIYLAKRHQQHLQALDAEKLVEQALVSNLV